MRRFFSQLEKTNARKTFSLERKSAQEQLDLLVTAPSQVVEQALSDKRSVERTESRSTDRANNDTRRLKKKANRMAKMLVRVGGLPRQTKKLRRDHTPRMAGQTTTTKYNRIRSKKTSNSKETLGDAVSKSISNAVLVRGSGALDNSYQSRTGITNMASAFSLPGPFRGEKTSKSLTAPAKAILCSQAWQSKTKRELKGVHGAQLLLHTLRIHACWQVLDLSLIHISEPTRPY